MVEGAAVGQITRETRQFSVVINREIARRNTRSARTTDDEMKAKSIPTRVPSSSAQFLISASGRDNWDIWRGSSRAQEEAEVSEYQRCIYSTIN
jgi:hypothetical protein